MVCVGFSIVYRYLNEILRRLGITKQIYHSLARLHSPNVSNCEMGYNTHVPVVFTHIWTFVVFSNLFVELPLIVRHALPNLPLIISIWFDNYHFVTTHFFWQSISWMGENENPTFAAKFIRMKQLISYKCYVQRYKPRR